MAAYCCVAASSTASQSAGLNTNPDSASDSASSLVIAFRQVVRMSVVHACA